MAPSRVITWPLSIEPYWRRVPGAVPLLHAIAEEPDDLTIRLVLADLCDDHGEAGRAEFIRRHVAHLRDGTNPHGDERIEELYTEGVAVWTEGVPYSYGVGREFRGGLLEQITVAGHPKPTAAAVRELFAFVDVRRAIVGVELFEDADFRAAILPRLVRLDVRACVLSHESWRSFTKDATLGNLRELGVTESHGHPDGFDLLASSPWAAGLRVLHFESTAVEDEGLRRLTEKSRLTGLTELSLDSTDVTADSAAILAAWPGAAGLRKLDLGYNHLGDDGLIALAGSAFLGRLEELNLARNMITAAGVNALCASPGLPWLRVVTLDDNPLGAAGNIAAALRFPKSPDEVILAGTELGDAGLTRLLDAIDRPIRVLDLGFCTLTSAGVRRLAAWPGLANVESLTLTHNNIGTRGLHRLLSSPHLGRLRTLGLAWAGIGTDRHRTPERAAWPAGLVELDLWGNALGDAAHFPWNLRFPPTLAVLRLTQCNLRPAGLRRLADAGAFACLLELSLINNPLGVCGARVLAACPDLVGLERLDLYSAELGAEGAGAILSSPYLGELTVLGLGNNGIDDEGLAALARGDRPPKLAELNLADNEFSSEAGDAFVASQAFKGVAKIILWTD